MAGLKRKLVYKAIYPKNNIYEYYKPIFEDDLIIGYKIYNKGIFGSLSFKGYKWQD